MSDRILTVPNLISVTRLVALPFVYLDLVSGRHLRALILLFVFGATDWIDGYVARRFDQISRLGQLLDPIADRVSFVVVGIGSVLGGLLPWWAVVLIVARDVLLLAAGGLLLSRRLPPPAVTRVGKTATAGLALAFFLFVLASVSGDGARDPQPVLDGLAWLTFIVNVGLYYLAAVGYARQVLSARPGRADGPTD